jgi:hypothetical protein
LLSGVAAGYVAVLGVDQLFDVAQGILDHRIVD